MQNVRASDSAVFRNSTLIIAMENNILGIPENVVNIEDDVCRLGSNLLKLDSVMCKKYLNLEYFQEILS